MKLFLQMVQPKGLSFIAAGELDDNDSIPLSFVLLAKLNGLDEPLFDIRSGH